MLLAFKLPTTKAIVPFSAVEIVWESGAKDLHIITSNGSYTWSFYSEEDRNKQLANFETWLTTKPNSA